MKEFYKNPKRNSLRYIVFKNKTRQLPYLRLVPKNQMKFWKPRGKVRNTICYSFILLPNNEYHRYQSRYKDKNGKRRRWHEFSCVSLEKCFTIKNLKQITYDKKVKDISSLGRIKRGWHRYRHSLRNISNNKVANR